MEKLDKTCCACNETKEIKKFYVNKAAKDGYHPRCKKCMTAGLLCQRGRPYGTKKLDSTPGKGWEEIRLVNTSKEDYIETYLFLQRIGYNLDESIHQQFCDKHNLKLKKPKPKKNYFSPKDCNLL